MELTKLVFVHLKVGTDHLLEVWGQITNMYIKTWVRILSQVIVEFRDGLLEQISRLELLDDLGHLVVRALVARS